MAWQQYCLAKPRDTPYRGVYDRAVAGRSLRAAVDSQCLECVGYHTAEVRACTALACPLYAVRPYKEIPQSGHDDRVISAESTNSGREVSEVGAKRKDRNQAGKRAEQLGGGVGSALPGREGQPYDALQDRSEQLRGYRHSGYWKIDTLQRLHQLGDDHHQVRRHSRKSCSEQLHGLGTRVKWLASGLAR